MNGFTRLGRLSMVGLVLLLTVAACADGPVRTRTTPGPTTSVNEGQDLDEVALQEPESDAEGWSAEKDGAETSPGREAGSTPRGRSTLGLEPSAGEPGQEIVASGRGWEPGTSVFITVRWLVGDDVALQTDDLGRYPVGEDGRFRARFLVRGDAVPQEATVTAILPFERGTPDEVSAGLTVLPSTNASLDEGRPAPGEPVADPCAPPHDAVEC
jgi:hypothetical protein